MRSFPLSFIVAASMALSACTTAGGGKSSGNDQPGSYCYEHPAVCGIGGALIVAGTLAIIGNSNSGGNGGCGVPPRAHGSCK